MGIKQFWALGSAGNPPQSGTRYYVPNAYYGDSGTVQEVERQVVAAGDITITAIYGLINKNIGGTITFTVHDDGVATSAALTIDSTNDNGVVASATDLDVSIASGSIIELVQTTSLSAVDTLNLNHTWVVVYTNDESQEFQTHVYGNGLSAGTDFPLSGYIDPTITSQIETEVRVPIACTLEDAKVVLSDTITAGETVRLTLLKNGSSTGETLDISDLTAGDVATWSDIGVEFAAGDKASINVTAPVGTPTLSQYSFGGRWTPGNPGQWWSGSYWQPNNATSDGAEGHGHLFNGDNPNMSPWDSRWETAATTLLGFDGMTLVSVAVELDAAPGAGDSIAYSIEDIDTEDITDLFTVSDSETEALNDAVGLEFAEGQHLSLRYVTSGTPAGAETMWGFGFEDPENAGSLSGGLYGPPWTPFVPKQGGSPTEEDEPGPPWNPSGFEARQGGAVTGGPGAGSDRITWPNEDPGVPQFKRQGGTVEI